ncbi:VWA domain-containing protein [Gammaproteobacteria bacterium]|nr:VWA domain-containing protein [Gammaproteobacteria bacterium]
MLFFLLDFQEEKVFEETNLVIKPIVDDFDSAELDEKLTSLKNLNEIESQKIERLERDLIDAITLRANKKVNIQQRLIEVNTPVNVEKRKTTNFSGELVGMTVKGEKVTILMDRSASMSFRTLVNIITAISDRTGSRLGSGPKWEQTKSIVEWLLENTPPSSQVQLISYSDKVEPITAKWVPPAEALNDFNAKIPMITPNGGTSLGNALEYLSERLDEATDIYIITDGLPTLPGKKNKGVSALQKCFRLPSRKPRFVDGGCREALFQSAIERFSRQSNATVNIILLPLEGDPKGSPNYWGWAAATGGRLLSPSSEWP